MLMLRLLLNIIIGGMDELEQEKVDSSFNEADELDDGDDLEVSSVEDDDPDAVQTEKKPSRSHKKIKYNADAIEDDDEESSIFDNNTIVDKLPEDRTKLRELLSEVERKIKFYKSEFLKEE